MNDIYSRNTNKRGANRTQRQGEQPNLQAVETENTFSREKQFVPMPDAPPNYRGMIYDINGIENKTENAEGISRLVTNDEAYSDYEKKNRYDRVKKREAPVFSHLKPPLEKKAEKGRENGIDRLIDGLQSKSFAPEDVLIGAMIILMLNSSSEDDILMVLVLMMLL